MKTRLLPLAVLLLAPVGTSALSQAPASDTSSANEAEPAAPADDSTKIKCRSISITGSLAKKERVCKTIAEWRRLREAGSDAARAFVDYSRERQMSN